MQKYHNLEKAKNIKKTLKLKCYYLWTRKGGSKITDLWEIADDHKHITVLNAEKKKSLVKIQPKIIEDM